MDAVGIRCSDGTDIRPMGGSGGTANIVGWSSQLKGFDKIQIKSGDYIDSIQLQDVDRTSVLSRKFGGNGGSTTQYLTCPNGARLSGLSGNFDQSLRYLEATCNNIDPYTQ